MAIEGRLQIRTYDYKSGEKRTAAEVVADNIQMLGKRPGEAAGPAENTAEQSRDEEIPF